MSNTGYKYIYHYKAKRDNSDRFQVKMFAAHRNLYIGGVVNTLEEAIRIREQYLKENGIDLYLQK